jgi:hypothetical protein
MVALLSFPGVGSAAIATTACAATPEAAARLYGETSATSLPREDKGYRVANIRWDPVMRQSWATIVSCAHPEWPAVVLRTSEANHASRGLSAQAREERAPIVRAGDVVELWRQEDLLRIEVTGVAEQSGGLGETIRVRLLRPQGSSQSVEQQLSGVVRGRADVEMQP